MSRRPAFLPSFLPSFLLLAFGALTLAPGGLLSRLQGSDEETSSAFLTAPPPARSSRGWDYYDHGPGPCWGLPDDGATPDDAQEDGDCLGGGGSEPGGPMVSAVRRGEAKVSDAPGLLQCPDVQLTTSYPCSKDVFYSLAPEPFDASSCFLNRDEVPTAGSPGSVGADVLLPWEGFDRAPIAPDRFTGRSARGGAPLDSPHVRAATGELVWVETDLELPGVGLEFEIRRTYRSRVSAYPSHYGRGWELNVHRRIQMDWYGGQPGELYWSPGTGPVLGPYTFATGNWSDPADWDPGRFELDSAPDPDVIRRYEPSGSRETYTRLESDWFYLTSVRTLSGAEILLEYEPTGLSQAPEYRLSRATDTVGRQIEFVWNSADEGRLSEVVVRDPAGQELGRVTYAYADLTLGTETVKVLASVEGLEVAAEDGSGWSFRRPVREYVYEARVVRNLPAALLTDVRSAREVGGQHPMLRHWTYDSDPISGWRVTRQEDGPGTEETAH